MTFIKEGYTNSDKNQHKKSSNISLVLLGVSSLSTLTACSEKIGYEYHSLHECKEDWGVEKCLDNGGYDIVSDNASGSGSGTHYAYLYNTSEKEAQKQGINTGNIANTSYISQTSNGSNINAKKTESKRKTRAKSVKRGGFGRIGRAGA